MKMEIQITGFGGQGIVLAGVVLAEAGARDGMYVVQSQSYGPESRGGAARTDVILSGAPIDYPKVTAADVLVALSQPAFDKYAPLAKPRARVLVDRDLVEAPAEDGRVQGVPFATLANELGKRVTANMVMLGALATLTGCVSRPSLEAAVRLHVPPGTEALNLKALDLGFRSAEP